MFDQNTKRRMETAHDIFVSKPTRHFYRIQKGFYNEKYLKSLNLKRQASEVGFVFWRTPPVQHTTRPAVRYIFCFFLKRKKTKGCRYIGAILDFLGF